MKYSLLLRQIPEIPALKLESEQRSGAVIIHRTNNCVIYFDKSQKPKTALNPSRHKSDTSHAFKTGEIVEVGKIYDEISRSFFDESHNTGSLKLRDELIQRSSRNPHIKNSSQIQTKLKSMTAVKDPQIKDIKSRILFTNRRLKQSKAGNPTESQQVSKDSSNSFILNNTLDSPNKAKRKKLIDSHRNLTFEQKLEFYNENPVIAERRIRTSHFPWEKPEVPALTSTPENSKFFTKKEVVQENKVKNVLKFHHRNSINLDYLKNPELLGSDGGKLLLQIMNDEKQNVKASAEEIVEFNRIIHRRIRRMNARQNGWENEIYRYAVDKVNLVPTCNPVDLIKSYFNYMRSGSWEGGG